MELKFDAMLGFLEEMGAKLIQRGGHTIQKPYFIDFNFRSKDYYFVIDDMIDDRIELWDWNRMMVDDECLFKINLSDPESFIKLRQYMNSL